MPALLVQELTKKYRADPGFSLNIDSLSIEEGEFLALLGPSGCGKTTLLKIIAGLLQPDGGEIFAGGQRMTAWPAERRGFGMVFQQPLLFPHMTVEDNIGFGLKMKKVPKKERLFRSDALLERAGLSGFGPRYPMELSGGQQQRVSLLRALITQPKLLLMDEPFSALDQNRREEMRDWLKEIHQSSGTTILFITHDRDEAFHLADRIGVMKGGRLLQVDSPENLYFRPVNPDVARLIGLKNLVEGEQQGDYFVSGKLRIPLASAGLAKHARSGWLLVRPEAVKILEENEIYPAPVIEGTVKSSSFLQGYYQMQVESASHLLTIKQPAGALPAIHPGSRIRMAWNPEQLHFIPEGD